MYYYYQIGSKGVYCHSLKNEIMRKFLFMFLCFIFALSVRAEYGDVTINGIVYHVYRDFSVFPHSYAYVKSGEKCSGHVSIRASVTFQSKSYTVEYIQSGAFRNNDSITSVYIPSSIKNAYGNPFIGCSSLEKNRSIRKQHSV